MADPMPPNLDNRFIADLVGSLQEQVRELQKPTGTQQAQVVTNLARQVELLTSMQRLEVAQGSPAGDFTGFREAAAVKIVSQTGRIEVNWGGCLNGGEGYFLYSVEVAASGGTSVLVAKETVQADPARRVSVTGGSAFSPSGRSLWVESVPVGAEVTVRLWYNATSSFVYFMGGSLLVRVAP